MWYRPPTADPLYTSWNARDSATEVWTNSRESMVQYEVVGGNQNRVPFDPGYLSFSKDRNNLLTSPTTAIGASYDLANESCSRRRWMEGTSKESIQNRSHWCFTDITCALSNARSCEKEPLSKIASGSDVSLSLGNGCNVHLLPMVAYIGRTPAPGDLANPQ